MDQWAALLPQINAADTDQNVIFQQIASDFSCQLLFVKRVIGHGCQYGLHDAGLRQDCYSS